MQHLGKRWNKCIRDCGWSPIPWNSWKVKKVKVNICYSAPSILRHHTDHRGAQVHGAHQAASHIPAWNLPSRSRYCIYRPFKDGGLSSLSPGPGYKEQLAHGCYATARDIGARTRISQSKVEHAKLGYRVKNGKQTVLSRSADNKRLGDGERRVRKLP